MDIDFTKPLDELEPDEWQGEIQHWRQMFGQLDDNVRYYLARAGQPARVVTRNYRGYLGTFLEAHFDLKEVEIGVEVVEFDQTQGERFREVKVLRLPMSNIVQFEFLSEREQWLEPDADAEDTTESDIDVLAET